jgi:hypothetical protein
MIRSPARRRRSRGSAMVETALVLVPMLAVTLATFDYAVAIFLQTTFRHAVREGVRYAVTSQTMDGMGQDASIKTVVQRNAMGFLNGAANAEKIKIRYYDPVTLAETASNAGGNLVEVSIEGYQWSWMAPIMRSATPLTITVRSSDRMEASPNGIPPAR